MFHHKCRKKPWFMTSVLKSIWFGKQQKSIHIDVDQYYMVKNRAQNNSTSTYPFPFINTNPTPRPDWVWDYADIHCSTWGTRAVHCDGDMSHERPSRHLLHAATCQPSQLFDIMDMWCWVADFELHLNNVLSGDVMYGRAMPHPHTLVSSQTRPLSALHPRALHR